MKFVIECDYDPNNYVDEENIKDVIESSWLNNYVYGLRVRRTV